MKDLKRIITSFLWIFLCLNITVQYQQLLSSLVTGFLSSLVLLPLSQWWTPPLRLQVSACSTFLMMCDVPSMAVFVGNLLTVVLVLFPDIFVNFYFQFRWPQWLLVWQSISCSTFSEFLYLDFYTLIYHYHHHHLRCIFWAKQVGRTDGQLDVSACRSAHKTLMHVFVTVRSTVGNASSHTAWLSTYIFRSS
jgi:hypothetical protein